MGAHGSKHARASTPRKKTTAAGAVNSREISRGPPPWRVHRDVLERVIAFLTVPQQACARRAGKALWEAVRAASLEDLLNAAVHHDAIAVDAQLVVVAMSRALGSFPSEDALVAWSGGLGVLCEDLQLRFPHAAAIGISARLAATCPLQFASGWSMATMCVVAPVVSALPVAFAVESFVMGVRNPNVLVSALSHDNAPCPIVCIDGATAEHFPHMLPNVPLSSLTSIRKIPPSVCEWSFSLTSLCLANLPLLESIGDRAFYQCTQLCDVDLSALPSLQKIGESAFYGCASLFSIRLVKLPLLDSIGSSAFRRCVDLYRVEFSQLSSLRCIDTCAFSLCTSLQSVDFVDLPCLKTIGSCAFYGCVKLSSVSFSNLPVFQSIGESAFNGCKSLRFIRLVALPRLECIGEEAFCDCGRLTKVELSGLPSLRTVQRGAFLEALQAMRVAEGQPCPPEVVGRDAFSWP